MSVSQNSRRLAVVVTALALGAGGIVATTSSTIAHASSKPDVVKGHKVKLTYGKYCSTKNGKLYVKVSKKAAKNAYLCSGKVSTDKYAMPMYMNFIVTKYSDKGSSARVNVLLQLSPAATQRWEYTTMKLKPFAVGYRYSGKSTKYSYSTYHWFHDLAAKNTRYIGEFLVTSINNDTGDSTVFSEQFELPVFYKSAT